MTDEEIAEFIERSRTATMATVLPDGRPHLVAMWYAVVDGEIWFETKAKSQKAVNLRRDPTITVMIEDGQTYDTLRGVSIDGHAEIVDDPETILRVGISVWERYTGPYTDEMRPFVDQMMNNRIAVRVVPAGCAAGITASSACRRCRWAAAQRSTSADAAETSRAAGLSAAAQDLQVRRQGARPRLPPHRRKDRRELADRRGLPQAGAHIAARTPRPKVGQHLRHAVALHAPRRRRCPARRRAGAGSTRSGTSPPIRGSGHG